MQSVLLASLRTRKQQQFLNYLSVLLPPPQKRVSSWIYLFHGPVCRVIALGFYDFSPMDFLFLIQQRGKKEKISCQCHLNHNRYKFTPLNKYRSLFIKHSLGVCGAVNRGREIWVGRGRRNRKVCISSGFPWEEQTAPSQAGSLCVAAVGSTDRGCLEGRSAGMWVQRHQHLRAKAGVSPVASHLFQEERMDWEWQG